MPRPVRKRGRCPLARRSEPGRTFDWSNDGRRPRGDRQQRALLGSGAAAKTGTPSPSVASRHLAGVDLECEPRLAVALRGLAVVVPQQPVRIHDMLSVGVGVRATLDLETNTEAVVVDAEGTELKTQLGNAVTIGGRAAPHAGVLFEPTPWLRFGLTWRLGMYVDDWGYNDVDATRLPGLALGSFGYTHHFAHYFTPMTVSIGLALEPIEPLNISLDVTWSQWSEYLDSDHENHDGELFGDTVTPRVGLSWRFVPSTALLAGYYYEHPEPRRHRSRSRGPRLRSSPWLAPPGAH